MPGLNPIIKQILPIPVFKAISHHLVRAGRLSEEGFPSGEEEEDALSGDMLRALRHRRSQPIEDRGRTWQWQITTRKFRGRGELATESLIGADGIVQIEITQPDGQIFRKGVLFQAKKNWRHRDGNLLGQVKLMESHAPGGSVVFNYQPEHYTAVSSSEVVMADGNPTRVRPKRLGEFLANDFLNCFAGRQDTYYDWQLKGLVLAGQEVGFIRLHPQFLAAIQVDSTVS